MTAPLPSPYLSPMAGLANALLRLHNRAASTYVRELEVLLADAREARHELTTARDFADSDAAGYIDRTDIWGTQ